MVYPSIPQMDGHFLQGSFSLDQERRNVSDLASIALRRKNYFGNQLRLLSLGVVYLAVTESLCSFWHKIKYRNWTVTARHSVLQADAG